MDPIRSLSSKMKAGIESYMKIHNNACIKITNALIIYAHIYLCKMHLENLAVSSTIISNTWISPDRSLKFKSTSHSYGDILGPRISR